MLNRALATSVALHLALAGGALWLLRFRLPAPRATSIRVVTIDSAGTESAAPSGNEPEARTRPAPPADRGSTPQAHASRQTPRGTSPGLSADAVAARVVADIKPEYPVVARRLGEEGDVTLQALIRPDGGVAEVRLLKSSGHARLDEAAVAALRTARFRIPPELTPAAPIAKTLVIAFNLRGDQ
jgi:protein TonB